GKHGNDWTEQSSCGPEVCPIRGHFGMAELALCASAISCRASESNAGVLSRGLGLFRLREGGSSDLWRVPASRSAESGGPDGDRNNWVKHDRANRLDHVAAERVG